jgi:hypothetical protein
MCRVHGPQYTGAQRADVEAGELHLYPGAYFEQWGPQGCSPE